MISETQLGWLDARCRGHLSGISAAAFRSASEQVAEEYIRDIGGIPFVRRCVPVVDGRTMVSAPDGGIVSSIDHVFAGSEEVPGWSWEYLSAGEGRVMMASYVSCGDSVVTVSARWLPTQDTEELPEEFFRVHCKAIRDGVLAFLLSQSGRPWGDAATAAHFAIEFDKDKYDARRVQMSDASGGGKPSLFDRCESWL